jgi:hypothetical protein
MNQTMYVQKSMSYPQYKNLIEELLKQGKTTGPDQSEAMVNYAKLNLQRMQRIEKTVVLTDELKSVLKLITKPHTAIVLTEGWCGDAAQNLPLFYLMQQENPNFKLKLLLRDEHLELMDQYLTNGGRSIPKLIFLGPPGEELFTWGPRPETAQKFVMEAKENGLAKEEMANELHLWYAKDKLKSTQLEITELLRKYFR